MILIWYKLRRGLTNTIKDKRQQMKMIFSEKRLTKEMSLWLSNLGWEQSKHLLITSKAIIRTKHQGLN
jgi:hypothetical protein